MLGIVALFWEFWDVLIDSLTTHKQAARFLQDNQSSYSQDQALFELFQAHNELPNTSTMPPNQI